MVNLYYTICNKKLEDKQFDEKIHLLPKYMQDRIRNYRRWQDAHASLFGKLLLMKGLSELGFEEGIIEKINYDKYNNPFLNNSVYFNISHSGSYVLCVLSQRTKVGIDIEKIVPVKIQDFKNQFTGDERISIESSADKYKSFFSYWTKKEAVIKADGRGLSIPLNTISITFGGAYVENTFWFLKDIKLIDNYMIHLATRKKVDDIKIISLEF